VATVPGFQNLLTAVAATQGVLPTSGAIAGVWATNDASRGVWNAPANVGIATMVMPKLPIAGDDQDDLNVPVQGLAVNAIRTFQGRGSLIWGARTLDSLSNDWRYIQVRRTMIYVEQSVKQALDAMVFRPNTAQTWVTVVSMIESFLHGLWAAGGLMGSSPAQAYNVVAGLGSTMTPDDVLNGVMRVQVTLQMVHPAEFIELTFKQQMLGGA
jgi:phage tail sheath protein FI